MVHPPSKHLRRVLLASRRWGFYGEGFLPTFPTFVVALIPADERHLHGVRQPPIHSPTGVLSQGRFYFVLPIIFLSRNSHDALYSRTAIAAAVSYFSGWILTRTPSTLLSSWSFSFASSGDMKNSPSPFSTCTAPLSSLRKNTGIFAMREGAAGNTRGGGTLENVNVVDHLATKAVIIVAYCDYYSFPETPARCDTTDFVVIQLSSTNLRSGNIGLNFPSLLPPSRSFVPLLHPIPSLPFSSFPSRT